MKILVVEDDRKVAGFIEQGLKEEGYVVDIAADGDEAGTLAHVYEYDVILLDVVLPKKNGFQVALELEIVEGVGENEIDRSRRQPRHLGDAIAVDDAVGTRRRLWS